MTEKIKRTGVLNMKKILLSVTAALMAVIMLASCSSGTQNDGSASNGTTASSSDKSTSSNSASAGILANFSATDLNGNTVDQTALADYKLTMVNVWATFCTPCLNEMPELGELADEYSGKGVQIVGLVTDLTDSDGSISQTQLETAQDIVGKTGADYTHIVPSTDMYGLLSQITSVPTTFFVDSKGNQVGMAYVGARDKASWAEIIDETLAEVQ